MTEPCPMLGFIVSIGLAPESSAAVRDEFRAQWLAFLAERGLYAISAGTDDREWAVASDASQASDADCDATRAWLAGRPELREARVGTIEDLNEAS
jgi:hypothetical protein